MNEDIKQLPLIEFEEDRTRQVFLKCTPDTIFCDYKKDSPNPISPHLLFDVMGRFPTHITEINALGAVQRFAVSHRDTNYDTSLALFTDVLGTPDYRDDRVAHLKFWMNMSDQLIELAPEVEDVPNSTKHPYQSALESISLLINHHFSKIGEEVTDLIWEEGAVRLLTRSSLAKNLLPVRVSRGFDIEVGKYNHNFPLSEESLAIYLPDILKTGSDNPEDRINPLYRAEIIASTMELIREAYPETVVQQAIHDEVITLEAFRHPHFEGLMKIPHYPLTKDMLTALFDQVHLSTYEKTYTMYGDLLETPELLEAVPKAIDFLNELVESLEEGEVLDAEHLTEIFVRQEINSAGLAGKEECSFKDPDYDHQGIFHALEKGEPVIIFQTGVRFIKDNAMGVIRTVFRKKENEFNESVWEASHVAIRTSDPFAKTIGY